MNTKIRNFVIWIAVTALLVVLFHLLSDDKSSPPVNDIPFSTFLERVDAGQIERVTIRNQQISGFYSSSGTGFQTVMPPNFDLFSRLEEGKVITVVKEAESEGSSLLSLIGQFIPLLLFVGVWIFFMRHMQGVGGRAMGFGGSKAKPLNENKERVTFEEVAGVDEAKEDLTEIIEFLRDPGKFQRLGGRIPRGMLLVGPPGTGKTLIARAVAGEANVPFFTISGSDFVEMFVGVGASRVRDMFEQSKKNAPCIIFIDEIDAVGRHRGIGLGGGNDEREQTLNQLLVEMDGFEQNEGIIIIAATNRPDVLDPALLRPGRFDRQITISNPDVNGREKILRVHVRNVPMAGDVQLSTIARGTPGFSGADLMNLVNEAALLAARRNKRVVTMQEFEYAKDKVMMGPERKSMMMSEEDKCITAYHEAGHAIVALTMPVLDPIHKATIIPRGRALGMVMTLPESDKYSISPEKAHAQLVMLFGGREAEVHKFGPDKTTNGAQSDIQAATNLTRSMVTEWGMSDKLGRVRYKANAQEVFLGHPLAHDRQTSDETNRLIDRVVKEKIEEAERKARQLICEHEEQFEAIAKALLRLETLTGDELRDIMLGIEPDRLADDISNPDSPTTSSVPEVGEAAAPYQSVDHSTPNGITPSSEPDLASDDKGEI